MFLNQTGSIGSKMRFRYPSDEPLRPAEVGPVQLGLAQVGPLQIRAAQFRIPQVGMHQIGVLDQGAGCVVAAAKAVTGAVCAVREAADRALDLVVEAAAGEARPGLPVGGRLLEPL